ncbi:metallophosphoesterase [Saccharibacillus sp. CPCC 101409]|uniref:metallophosphoesterase family protein n=1 Tax=Saccharibacillus sp. CPCC 101409 TaxID=3058041 RepID=UPI002673A0FA|nr:metallophosphoesterase [Saccharibacillus sp. CPCC 101409]MDO3410471.1 metallophosphoesterase [Saccharibacillus sp. CPCC 101409]
MEREKQMRKVAVTQVQETGTAGEASLRKGAAQSAKGRAFGSEQESGLPLANFQVMTDTHIRDDADHIYNRHFAEALEDIASFCAGSLGIMHVGDVTDRGLAAEYGEFRRLWESRPAGLPELYLTPGNHDIGAVLWDEGGAPVDLTLLPAYGVEAALDGGALEAGEPEAGERQGGIPEVGAAAHGGAAEAGGMREAGAAAHGGAAEGDSSVVRGEASVEADGGSMSGGAVETAAAAGFDYAGLMSRLAASAETGPGVGPQELWRRRMRRFEAGTGISSPYHDHWIGGWHFIFLGSESPDPKDAYLSAEQLNWLELKLAERASPERPVFVFLHQPLIDTVAGSTREQGWHGVEPDEVVKDILSGCPQAILFSGHTHWQLEAPRMMYDGENWLPAMFNASSVGYLWTDADEHLEGSQGLQVDIYNDRVVVRGRDFTRRRWIESAEHTVAYAAGVRSIR